MNDGRIILLCAGILTILAVGLVIWAARLARIYGAMKRYMDLKDSLAVLREKLLDRSAALNKLLYAMILDLVADENESDLEYKLISFRAMLKLDLERVDFAEIYNHTISENQIITNIRLLGSKYWSYASSEKTLDARKEFMEKIAELQGEITDAFVDASFANREVPADRRVDLELVLNPNAKSPMDAPSKELSFAEATVRLDALQEEINNKISSGELEIDSETRTAIEETVTEDNEETSGAPAPSDDEVVTAGL